MSDKNSPKEKISRYFSSVIANITGCENASISVESRSKVIAPSSIGWFFPVPFGAHTITQTTSISASDDVRKKILEKSDDLISTVLKQTSIDICVLTDGTITINQSPKDLAKKLKK